MQRTGAADRHYGARRHAGSGTEKRGLHAHVQGSSVAFGTKSCSGATNPSPVMNRDCEIPSSTGAHFRCSAAPLGRLARCATVFFKADPPPSPSTATSRAEGKQSSFTVTDTTIGHPQPQMRQQREPVQYMCTHMKQHADRVVSQPTHTLTGVICVWPGVQWHSRRSCPLSHRSGRGPYRPVSLAIANTARVCMSGVTVPRVFGSVRAEELGSEQSPPRQPAKGGWPRAERRSARYAVTRLRYL